MDNLKKVLDDFLSDQEERLSKRTYNDYVDVISLFEDYLNSYAYNFYLRKSTKILKKKLFLEKIVTVKR